MRRAAAGATVAWVMEACGGLGDFWAQSTRQAREKGLQGGEAWRGRRACAAHAVSYTALQAAGVVAANRLLHLELRPARVVAGLALAGVSHYAMDRREPLRRLAQALGREDFYRMTQPVWGAFEMDQAAHRALNTLAAFVMTSE